VSPRIESDPGRPGKTVWSRLARALGYLWVVVVVLLADHVSWWAGLIAVAAAFVVSGTQFVVRRRTR
jgi:hypothetical protein